jgi:hypothetical protein
VHKREKPAGKSVWRAVLAAVSLAFASGCAVHYFDEKTGTDHIWGFGHMKLKVNAPRDNLTSVVKGTQTFGVGVGAGNDHYGVVAGWENRRQIVVMTNSVVLYEWPELNSSFFTVRVSSNLPPKWVEYNKRIAQEAASETGLPLDTNPPPKRVLLPKSKEEKTGN